jgi:hypothetical protein
LNQQALPTWQALDCCFQLFVGLVGLVGLVDVGLVGLVGLVDVGLVGLVAEMTCSN